MYSHKKAVDGIAEYLASLRAFDGDVVVIPAPQHEGYARYTAEIAKRLSYLTGVRVADILRCVPHESLYEMKQKGIDYHPRIYLQGKVPEGKLYFLDNVIATGRTFRAARNVLGHAMEPLVYAVDENASGNFLRM